MSIPSLLPYDRCSPKVYKLLYASRLADHGLPAQALTYCEHIATVLLGQDPASHPVLAQQLVKVSLMSLLRRSRVGASLGFLPSLGLHLGACTHRWYHLANRDGVV